ncbi:hypothetical protein AgCh_038294 [Apium graveolens]
MHQTMAFFKSSFVSAPSPFHISKQNMVGNSVDAGVNIQKRAEIVCLGMLAPRKFMQKRRKIEVFKDASDEADQKNWRKLMTEIEESNSAVSVLRSKRIRNEALPKHLVLGTLVRFKQLKKWKLVGEGDFNKAERILGYMSKRGYPSSVISYTALMEAYGKGGQYNKAEAIFRRMQSSGPEPSAVTYQIIFKTFVEGDKFKEAEEIFETLLNKDESPCKPDQKMFHMMIYMHKKAGNYEKARKLFALMAERDIQHTTVTYNSLMSYETNYKEVANIYDQMQRDGLRPDVVSYALLISAYGKARREEEALAVFEEMLDAGVRPTQKAYNILLDAFAISGMVEQARTIFKSMRRDRCTPDLYSYSTMLSAYVNASDMDGAEKFFRRIKHDGFDPSVVTYGNLIKGYAKINDLENMMKKYEEMCVCGIKANQTVFTTIMDAYGKNKDFGSAVVWFKEMGSCGVPPDQKAKNILLSLASTPEEQREAYELVGQGDHLLNDGRSTKFPIINDDFDDDDDDLIEDVDYVDTETLEQTVSSVLTEGDLLVSRGVYEDKNHVLAPST